MDNEYSFRYDGKSARTMKISMQGPIRLSGAEPMIDTTRIPGRSGDLHSWDGTYGNRVAEANCYLLSGVLDKDIAAVNAWLLGSQKYRRLVLEDDPYHFMLARAMNGVTRQARAGMLTPFTLRFDCRPEKFLTIGEREYDVTSTGSIFNPTGFPANPIIRIEGSGDVAVSYGGGSLSVVGMDSPLCYDTETDKAYNGSVSLDSKVFAKGDLSIPPGKVSISKYDSLSDYMPTDYFVDVGDTFGVNYSDAGLSNSPSAVEISGSGALDWYDDGGTLIFAAKAAGVGTIKIWVSDSVVSSFTYRIKASGRITKITIIPRWWEL